MYDIWLFLLVWGVWILMPIIVDGADTLLRLFVVLVWGRDFKEHNLEDSQLPFVTMIIPAYNEEKIINRCLNSIKVQDYPHEKMEVIVIDDGSHDATALEVAGHLNGSSGNGKNGKNGANGKETSNGQVKNGVATKFDGGKPNGSASGHNGCYNGRNGINGKNGNSYVKINGDHIPLPDEFGGSIKLLSNGHVGKPSALNAGIRHMNHSDLVITIDSDVVLAPHAIRNAAAAFVEDPRMGAATGNIEISSEILEERDADGNLILDEEGKIIAKKLGLSETLLARCQFLEYLDAFRLGRQFQSLIHSTYILAGAFSIFRRDLLEETPLYRSHTVSEDFDLTVDIHKKQVHVGYVADSKAYLEPVIGWDGLYSQRVRWCRGQLEVCGLHREIIGNRAYGPIGWFGFPQMLLVDHTLAFPRLIWTFLLLFFPLFGYPPRTIATAIFFMYLFYVGLAFLQTMSAYFIVDEDTKKQIERTLSFCFVLPIYRLVTFYFRMSGYLLTLKEPASWKVEGPLNTLRRKANGFSNGNKTEKASLSEIINNLGELVRGLGRNKQDSDPNAEAFREAKNRAAGPDLTELAEKEQASSEEEKSTDVLSLFEKTLKDAHNPEDQLHIHVDLARMHYSTGNLQDTRRELSQAIALCQVEGKLILRRELDHLLQTISRRQEDFGAKFD